MENIDLLDVIAHNSSPEEIEKVDPSELRNKTISSLKQDILVNKTQLTTVHQSKEKLEEAKRLKLSYYESGFLPQVTKLFHMATDFRFSDIENADREIVRIESQEETIKENLAALEQQVRMKELAVINDWWKENENFFAKQVSSQELKEFKNSIFKTLVSAFDKDEAAFIDAAEKIRQNPTQFLRAA